MFHPINAYKLLKRTAKYIPKLRKLQHNLEFRHPIPSLADAYMGASLGLADILEYYDLNAYQIANGRIKSHSDDS